MIRVCPKRDAICPHGMACPYTIDRYECAEEPPMSPIPQEEETAEWRAAWISRIARLICDADAERGLGAPECVMKYHAERGPCTPENCDHAHTAAAILASGFALVTYEPSERKAGSSEGGAAVEESSSTQPSPDGGGEEAFAEARAASQLWGRDWDATHHRLDVPNGHEAFVAGFLAGIAHVRGEKT